MFPFDDVIMRSPAGTILPSKLILLLSPSVLQLNNVSFQKCRLNVEVPSYYFKKCNGKCSLYIMMHDVPFGAKPLSKPMLSYYCQLDPSEQTSVKF